jgi:hypothetical protein
VTLGAASLEQVGAFGGITLGERHVGEGAGVGIGFVGESVGQSKGG